MSYITLFSEHSNHFIQTIFYCLIHSFHFISFPYPLKILFNSIHFYQIDGLYLTRLEKLILKHDITLSCKRARVLAVPICSKTEYEIRERIERVNKVTADFCNLYETCQSTANKLQQMLQKNKN